MLRCSTWDLRSSSGSWALFRASVTIPESLDVGVYRWGLTCGVETYVSRDKLEVYPDGTTSYLRRTVAVRYGDAIALRGYRWRATGGDLQISLVWEAVSPPGEDYKLFVHLIDVAGNIVRQYDAVPCAWQCPTSQWQAGEVVPDTASISLVGLPPGVYRLAVGLYSPETMERLPVQEESNRRTYAEGYFPLPDGVTITVSPLGEE